MLYRMIGVLSWVLVGLIAPGAVWADGAVYAMTNASGYRANEIVVYSRSSDGSLAYMQTIPTGGGGSGIQTMAATDPLGSQGSLMLDRRRRYLFAVNTESLADNTPDCQEGTISSFRVNANGSLKLRHRVLSRGLFPVSLTVYGNVLYVLNAGGPGDPLCGTNPKFAKPNITGFRIQPGGLLIPISASTRRINPGPNPGVEGSLDCDLAGGALPPCGLNPPAFVRSASQVGFTPDGQKLVVTVKGTNEIYVFPVTVNGRALAPTITQAPGPNQPYYFGFDFDKNGHLIVAEPFGAVSVIPNPAASTVSSFTINPGGDVVPISSSVTTIGRGTSCWVAISQIYAYISNNLSSDISAYTIASDGSLTLFDATAATANEPNDMAVAKDTVSGFRFLYVLNSGDGTIGAFRIRGINGSLVPLGAFGGLPVKLGAQGLAAY